MLIILAGIVFAAFKEWSDSHQANVIVPHDGVYFFLRWTSKGVLEYWSGGLAWRFLVRGRCLPSKAPLPVFSRNDFFSLL